MEKIMSHMLNKVTVEQTRFTIKDEDLTEPQLKTLANFNETLTTLEQNIKKEALTLLAECNCKLEDKQTCIDDYEVELEISFYLKESDPAFDEDRDNILEVLREGIKYNSFKTHLGASNNHNIFEDREGHPMYGEFHCWLYHSLYFGSMMSWIDILRVGDIWVDMDCTLQHFIHIDD